MIETFATYKTNKKRQPLMPKRQTL